MHFCFMLYGMHTKSFYTNECQIGLLENVLISLSSKIYNGPSSHLERLFLNQISMEYIMKWCAVLGKRSVTELSALPRRLCALCYTLQIPKARGFSL